MRKFVSDNYPINIYEAIVKCIFKSDENIRYYFSFIDEKDISFVLNLFEKIDFPFLSTDDRFILKSKLKNGSSYKDIGISRNKSAEWVRQQLNMVLEDVAYKIINLCKNDSILKAGIPDYAKVILVKLGVYTLQDYDYCWYINYSLLKSNNVENIGLIGVSAPLRKSSLSKRSVNCLYRAGVKTITDLMRFDNKRLSDVKNLNKRCIDEIIQYKNNYLKGSML